LAPSAAAASSRRRGQMPTARRVSSWSTSASYP